MADQPLQETKRQSATQRRVWLERAPSIAVRVYPNVIYVIENGRDVLALTPEQWAEMVEIVGITGFAPEPEDAER